MPRHPLSTLLCVAAFLAVAVAPARTADAQSAAELRRENESLKSQIRDLQAELEAARARVDVLELENKALRQNMGTNRPATPATPAPKITVDLNDPASSPQGMLNSIKEEYASQMKDVELDPTDQKQHILYLRHLNAWVQKTNRRRTPVDWHVTIERGRDDFGRTVFDLTPVDPVSGASLGEAFRADVPRVLIRRLEDQLDRGVITYVMKGLLVPQLVVNESRSEAGPFDNPPFIGPYCEFGYFVEVKSLNLPAKKDEKR